MSEPETSSSTTGQTAQAGPSADPLARPEFPAASAEGTDPLAPAAPSAADPPEPEVLAPEAERLPPCEGAARAIPDVDGPGRPSPIFLAVVSILTLASDIGTKLWAERRLEGYPGIVTVWENHLAFVLAKNRGGAWGLLQGTNENVRRPFFLLVSAAAIAFIVTLYRRLQQRQRALKWGLPLVLGGALGNVFDRIRYGHVIDFIDFRADWIKTANEWAAKYFKDHVVTDHWPTFNVADIAICVGVALMAIDMFTSKRGKRAPRPATPPDPPGDVAEAPLAAAPDSPPAPAEPAPPPPGAAPESKPVE